MARAVEVVSAEARSSDMAFGPPARPAAPSIRFLSIGLQMQIHASSLRSVALAQLRFTSFPVIN